MKIIGTQTMQRERARRVDEGSTIRWVPDGIEQAEVDVMVDVRELVRMYGERALKNKSGRSKMARGAVMLVARNLRRLP